MAVCSAEDDVDVFGRCPLLSYPKAWLLPTEKSADDDIINEVFFEVCFKVKLVTGLGSTDAPGGFRGWRGGGGAPPPPLKFSKIRVLGNIYTCT